MELKSGHKVASYIDKVGIWLGVNVDGEMLEVCMTPDEAETLIHDLAGQIFRITGSYKAVTHKGHPEELQATNDLAKRLLSGVIKEK